MKIAVVLVVAFLCAVSAVEVDSFDDVLLAKKEEAEHFGGTELEDANLEEENSDDLEFEARAPKRPCLSKCLVDPCAVAKCPKFKRAKCVRTCPCQARFYLWKFDVTKRCNGRPTTAAPTTAAPTTAAPTTAAPSNAPASQIEGYDNSDLELQEELFGQPRHNDDMIEREDDEGNAIDEDFE